MILHAVGLAIAVRGEGEGQGQDLAIDRQAPAAGLCDGVEAFFGRDVYEVGAGPGTRCEPPGLQVRRVRDDQGRRDYLEVTAEAYATFQQPREMTEETFAALESLRAPHIQGFVGYLDGAPVAAAALYLTHGVAGIGWVGTVSAHRGHRYAEAVTWAAVREGFKRGAIFANLQASPLGRPVYERMGFITPTRYHVLVGTV